jgi:predicted nucleotide-binding protein (sugar kinase/HSP70/actin superfamily)
MMNRSRAATAAFAALFVAVGLTACAGSANDTACKLYADGYNKMADLVKAKNAKTDGVTTEQVVAASDMLPSRIKDAFDRATGDVAVEMKSSLEMANAMKADPYSSDTGTAFFLTTKQVEKACVADGAGIKLHPTG